MSPAERVCEVAGLLRVELEEHKAASEALERVLTAKPVDFAALAVAAKRVYMATAGVSGFAACLATDLRPAP